MWSVIYTVLLILQMLDQHLAYELYVFLFQLNEEVVRLVICFENEDVYLVLQAAAYTSESL